VERAARTPTPADELLVHQLPRPMSVVGDASTAWFDRFYFCAHSPQGTPLLVLGCGIYPNAGVIDGFACVVAGGCQRNLRFSDELGGDRLRTTVGPLRWEVIEPLERWRIVLNDSDSRLQFDAVYTARSRPWLGDPIAVAHENGSPTEFAHYFQCGRWDGTVAIDGQEMRLNGWPGARDRSWGVRRPRERLGMHLWMLAQFDDRCVAVHYNEHRDGTPQHCDGAVLPDAGPPERVSAVAHNITLDEGGELVSARLAVRAGGQLIELECEGLHRGLYMAGAGYDGWHGQSRGREQREREQWLLGASFTPRSLPLGLVDKACRYRLADRDGVGIMELALSRSSSYTYRPRRLDDLGGRP
jgi:hypothetical protein